MQAFSNPAFCSAKIIAVNRLHLPHTEGNAGTDEGRQLKPFNYAAFKEQWLEGCEKYHIDPAAGPTSFTICNLRADQNKAAKNEHAALLTLAEVSDVLEAWLALGRWGWGVDLVEWSLISDLLKAAIGLVHKQDTTPQRLEDIGVTAEGEVLLIGLAELWADTRQELRDVLTPKQIEQLPTWSEICSSDEVMLPVPRALVVAS